MKFLLYSLISLCVRLQTSKVNGNYRFISNYPCVMSRWNYISITRSSLTFCSIIHHSLHPSRNILRMRSLTTISFYNRLYTFFPTPSWFKNCSANSRITQVCNFYLTFFKCSRFIRRRIQTFFCIFPKSSRRINNNLSYMYSRV